jgi:hypothetical protein
MQILCITPLPGRVVRGRASFWDNAPSEFGAMAFHGLAVTRRDKTCPVMVLGTASGQHVMIRPDNSRPPLVSP